MRRNPVVLARGRFGCLILLLALLPCRIEAAEPRVAHLRTSRDAFRLTELALSCEIAPRIQAGRDDAIGRGTRLESNYRFRILDEASTCRWDSGWIQALVPCEGVFRTPSLHVDWQPDSAAIADLSELRIEVVAEVSASACRPVQWCFYRWADGRFRSRPEPASWPEQHPVAAVDRSVPDPSEDVVFTVSPTPQIVLQKSVQPKSVVRAPRVSWGHLKTGYR